MLEAEGSVRCMPHAVSHAVPSLRTGKTPGKHKYDDERVVHDIHAAFTCTAGVARRLLWRLREHLRALQHGGALRQDGPYRGRRRQPLDLEHHTAAVLYRGLELWHLRPLLVRADWSSALQAINILSLHRASAFPECSDSWQLRNRWSACSRTVHGCKTASITSFRPAMAAAQLKTPN